eukprot:m.85305 g.85305  ORF g.85305 m.85305 type:complete len:50 (-) comp25858_c0_seq2:19-168(-)
MSISETKKTNKEGGKRSVLPSYLVVNFLVFRLVLWFIMSCDKIWKIEVA